MLSLPRYLYMFNSPQVQAISETIEIQLLLYIFYILNRFEAVYINEIEEIITKLNPAQLLYKYDLLLLKIQIV